MAEWDISDIGEKIERAVQSAVDSMNYERLSSDISSTVNNAINNAKQRINEAKKASEEGRSASAREDGNNAWHYTVEDDDGTYRTGKAEVSGGRQGHERFSGRATTHYTSARADKPEEKPSPLKNLINHNAKGSISGMLTKIFGYIGGAVFGMGSLSLLLRFLVTGAAGALNLMGFFTLPMFALSSWMVLHGTNVSGRFKRLQEYEKCFRKKTYCTIKELAKRVGKSEKYVLKDSEKLIAIGALPEGHIDEEKQNLIISDKTYMEYLGLKQQMRAKDAEKENERRIYEKNEELAKVIAEGERYVSQIKQANDAIPGEEISASLDRLEWITTKIFDYVKEHPEQLPSIRKFMDYYLPTTLKLVNAYKEFDAQPIQGENIKKAKDDIQKSLYTINSAFEKLFDSLYIDAAVDVSADISVLNTMLTREGLRESETDINRFR